MGQMRPAVSSVSPPTTVQLPQDLLRRPLSISLCLPPSFSTSLPLLAVTLGCRRATEGNGGRLKAGAEREGLGDGMERERERNGLVEKDRDEGE